MTFYYRFQIMKYGPLNMTLPLKIHTQFSTTEKQILLNLSKILVFF